MTHIRIDNERENSNRRFACGIGPELPPGDVYWFAGESQADRADCPGCNPNPRRIGTPLSEVTGTQLDAIGRQWRGEEDD